MVDIVVELRFTQGNSDPEVVVTNAHEISNDDGGMDFSWPTDRKTDLNLFIVFNIVKIGGNTDKIEFYPDPNSVKYCLWYEPKTKKKSVTSGIGLLKYVSVSNSNQTLRTKYLNLVDIIYGIDINWKDQLVPLDPGIKNGGWSLHALHALWIILNHIALAFFGRR